MANNAYHFIYFKSTRQNLCKILIVSAVLDKISCLLQSSPAWRTPVNACTLFTAKFLSPTKRLTFRILSCYSCSCWVMLTDCVSAPNTFPCKIRLPTVRAEEQPHSLPSTGTMEKRSWMLAPTALYLLHLRSLGSKTRGNFTFQFFKYLVLPLWLDLISNLCLLITRVGSIILLDIAV